MAYTNQMYLSKLNAKVYGHERAKKLLITLVQRAKTRYHQLRNGQTEGIASPLNCLLIGESGTGKTLLMRTLAETLNFPCVMVDALDLQPSGNKGLNPQKVKQMISDAVIHYGEKNILSPPFNNIVNQTVVFVDEIDKLGVSFESSGHWNDNLQSSFLTLIDNKEEFAGVSWIFAGAFTDMRSRLKTPDKQIGFVSQKSVSEFKITDEHLMEAGLSAELIGRMGIVASLDEFTANDVAVILRDYILPIKYAELTAAGVQFSELTDSELDEFAAVSRTGIRGIRRLIDEHYLEVEFNKLSGSHPGASS